MIVSLLTLIALVTHARAANWAQASGEIAQNTVIPYVPAPNTPHWTARFGMVAVVTPATNLSSFSYVYIMGGDTYDGDDTRRNHRPGLLDVSWENGYKNDVWRTTGTEWFVKGDDILKHEFRQKIPRVYSRLEWSEVNAGIRPPLGMTHQDWISCEAFFRNQAKPGVDCSTPRAVQWSPRRHHAGVYFKGHIWVLGGRAREFVALREDQAVGGIPHPLVQDIPRSANNALQQFSSQKEVSVLKSDVWRSVDGSNWELVTPGCRVNQKSLIASGNPKEGLHGRAAEACMKDADCYGAEVCDLSLRTCVCGIWSPREGHAVASYGEYLYLSGGYASTLYSQFSNCAGHACGATAASDYRYYLNDVWRSSNGAIWDPVTEAAFALPSTLAPSAVQLLGRGGHVMLALEDKSGAPYLWVLGGRGGDNTFHGGPEIVFGDVWVAPLTGSFPSTWQLLKRNGTSVAVPWTPRHGHCVALDPPTPENLFQRTLLLYGGQGADGATLDDLWSWRLDVEGEPWRRDFTPDELYFAGSGEALRAYPDPPAVHYVSPDSDLSFLRRFWVPTKPSDQQGSRYELRTYLPAEDMTALRSVGLNTIRDLAKADLYTMLKLRGFDFPQVPKEKRLHVEAACDYRAFAVAVVDKCELNLPSLYNGERQMPWNIVPAFGGAAPRVDHVKWHGRAHYDMLKPPETDVEKRTAAWDGCSYDEVIQGLHGPNVNGLGYVSQVAAVRDPLPEVQNLFCRQTPGPRLHAAMVAFQGLVYLFGGKQSADKFHADTWYRDPKLPSASILTAPADKSSEKWFVFSANKPGCFFEYRLWDPFNYKELRPWTAVTFKTSIAWLNWREGGPGSGEYVLYVRAVDPAGNRDDRFVAGINVHRWHYVSPTPWDIIMGVVGAFLGLLVLAYLEYRRRVKKAAMERYAMKRMRRKFKAMQRDVDGKAVDWRTLYMEAKQAEELGRRERKKLKKTRDKNAEKREKEKQRREKEKELIKRKLKANKEAKAKSASSSKAGDDPSKDRSGTSAALSSKKVAPLETVTEEDGEDMEAGLMKKTKAGTRASLRKQISRVAPNEEDGIETGEAVPEQEKGFKARKVNKRLKAYEQDSQGRGSASIIPGENTELFVAEQSNKDK